MAITSFGGFGAGNWGTPNDIRAFQKYAKLPITGKVNQKTAFALDNYSNNKCIDILNRYSKLINIYTKSDYFKKGDYISELIKENPCDIAIPLDLDEFIGIDNSFDKRIELKR